jgi:hypothetical protein
MKTNSNNKDEYNGILNHLNYPEFSQSSKSNIDNKETKSDHSNSIYIEENNSTNSIEHIKKNLQKNFNETSSEFNESKLHLKAILITIIYNLIIF